MSVRPALREIRCGAPPGEQPTRPVARLARGERCDPNCSFSPDLLSSRYLRQATQEERGSSTSQRLRLSNSDVSGLGIRVYDLLDMFGRASVGS